MLDFQGVAKPCHYLTLYDDSNFTPNEVIYLTFVLCHMYPLEKSAISLPIPVQHAHLAAERASVYLQVYSIVSVLFLSTQNTNVLICAVIIYRRNRSMSMKGLTLTNSVDFQLNTRKGSFRLISTIACQISGYKSISFALRPGNDKTLVL